MYNLDDKDVDRMSREAAERVKVPGNPDWESMQRALDLHLPQEKEKKRRGIFFFFMLAGLLLTGSLIWYGIYKSNHSIVAQVTRTEYPKPSANPIHPGAAENTASTEAVPQNKTYPHSNTSTLAEQPTAPGKAQIPLSTQTKNTPSSGTTLSASAITKNANQDPEWNQQRNNKDIAATSSSTSGKNNKTRAVKKATGKFNPSGKNAVDNILNAQIKSPNNNSLSALKQRVKYGKPGMHHPSLPVSAGTELNENLDNNNNLPKPDNELAKDNISNPNKPAETTIVGAPIAVVEKSVLKNQKDSSNKKVVKVKEVQQDSTAIAKNNKHKQQKDRAILAGITAGIDYSTVKFKYGNNAGYNIGFIGGYQFNKNWSATTGLLYTRKNYKLNGSDYHPPKHSPQSYMNIQTLDGFCKMWEIPLLVRYSFNTHTNNKFFIAAGISSYIMKRQQYNYDYLVNGNLYSKPWNTDSTFNHFFSILHLSAGIQKNIGKHMNWQIEPYAKIPLSGVGYGNIQLSSFGINFSIQYRQPVKH